MRIKKNIGIMGGTFDPIHNGHLMLAQNAYETLHLDKVLFMPSGISYMKNGVLDTHHRVAMVELAIQYIPYFELSLIEASREGDTYTFQTLRQLHDQYPQNGYYFIMGADSLFQIESWQHPDVIFELAAIVCTARDEYDMERLKAKGSELHDRYNARIYFLNMPMIDISSTDIRQKVRHGYPICQYVPTNVADYIKKERLYDEGY